MKKIKKVFFGTPDISVYFLEKLKAENFFFDLIITNPDRKVGRKQILTPSPVKRWALENEVEVLTPEKLDENFLEEIKVGGHNEIKTFHTVNYAANPSLFFVLAYGKILKKEILELPSMGVWNLHPSLLPKYRGPSPIMSAMLDDQKETGISLMLLDEKMDHGPILAQKKVLIDEWKKNNLMEKEFAEMGAELFLETLENFEKIEPKGQNHSEATYCEKYQKTDMELKEPLNQRKNFLKFLVFPKPFFFKDGKRYVVTDGKWKDNEFKILKVIPEGKKEREWKN